MIGSTGLNSSPGTDRYLEKARAVRLDHARRRGREISPDGSKGPEPTGERRSVTPFVPRRIQLIYTAVPGPPAGIKIITDPRHPYYRPTVEEVVDPEGGVPDETLHDPEIQTDLEEMGLVPDSIGNLIEETFTPSAESDQSSGTSSVDESIDKLKGLLDSLGHDTTSIGNLESLDAFLGDLVDQFSTPPNLLPVSETNETPEELQPVTPEELQPVLISNTEEELTAPLDLDIENLIPTDLVEIAEVEISAVPMTREEDLGEGDAKAVSAGTGSAFARTGPGSVGNADARSFGVGEAIAVTGDSSKGKTFASTTNSDVIAETGEGSSGNATATAAGEGQAAAITGSGSEGSAAARANGDGTAQALTGTNSKGDAAATALASGRASTVTGQDSLGKAIAISEGEADATASTGDGSVGNATASSAGEGASTASTGFNSGGDSTAISRSDGDSIALGGPNSSGLTRAEAHNSGDASAVGGESSRGQSIAEALGSGHASASTEVESKGNAIAKSKLSGNAAAEAGKNSTGNAHAITNAAGSAISGTGDASTGNATAKTDGAGDVSAVTGNGSSGHATAIANDKGGSASAIVTNGSAGNATSYARGKGNSFAVADGKGAVSAIAERDGGLLVINSSERPILVENRSNIDVEVLNVSDSAVRVEVTPAGITNISVPGFGTRPFEGNSFTILQDGAVVAREIAKPVPEEVGTSVPTVTPPEVNVGPLELTSVSPSSESQQDSVTLITGFEESGQDVDTNPLFISFSDFNPEPVSPEQFLVGGLPSENLISVVSNEAGDAKFDLEV
jgi:hypothetical protein